jgi:hypothetical protein
MCQSLCRALSFHVDHIKMKVEARITHRETQVQ